VSRQQKPSRQVPVDEQIQVVLAVLKGELPLAEAARRHGVSSATVGQLASPVRRRGQGPD
jgi:transposase